MSTFGERLRQLRLDAGLSQTALAVEGISGSYISLLESGRRSPSRNVAAQLAAQLGVSTSYLLDGEPSDQERRVELELAFSRLAVEHGQSASARDRLRELLADNLPPGPRDEAQMLLGRALSRLGEFEDAIAVALPLFERCRAGEATIPVSTVGMFLTWQYLEVGSDAQAVNAGEQALQACRDQGLAGTEDYFRLASTMMRAYGNLGDDSHASAWARQLITDAEAAGSRGGQAALYWNAAMVAERQGRIDEALHLCRQAMAHLSELDDGVDLARLRVAAAVILLSADPPHVGEAVAALERTKDLLDDLGGPGDLAEWNFARSWAALLEGDIPAAEAYARSAVERTAALDGADAPLSGRSLMALGDALAGRGDSPDALEQYRAAAQALTGRSNGRESAHAWRDLGERLVHQHDLEPALEAFRRALDCAGVRDRSRAALAGIEAAVRDSAVSQV